MCISIIIPKKFKYSVQQKKRTFRQFKFLSLKFGYFGLRILKPYLITTNHVFRFKMLFRKGARRSEKTLRNYWFFLFPNQPFTLKPKGLRMGKGKGKRQTWCINVPSGFVFVEFKNLRVGRSLYFLKQILYKLPVPAYITTRFSNYLRFSNGLGLIHPIYWN